MDADYINNPRPIVPNETAFGGLLKKIFDKLGPEVKINEKEKSVYITPRISFSNLTEAYYILKGYSIERF
jgi:hypothetical protein